jgi:outer membrane lipoprotein LolB
VSLGGCATLAPIERAERVYTGRFAAVIGQGDSRDSLAGRFTFAVRSDGTSIDLASPFGNTLARVWATHGRASLTAAQADGSMATWEGANPEFLAESVLGWSLPVTGLESWIAGRPVPERPAQVRPPQGKLQQIDQDGWIITIEERFDTGDPRILTFARATATMQPAFGLRLVLDGPPKSYPIQQAPNR